MRIRHRSIVILLSIFAFSWSAVGANEVAAQQKKPLKVFVLAGQSNMQGHAHVRTLKHIGMSDATAGLLKEIQDESGKPKVCEDVWVSYLSSSGTKQGRLTTGFGADENKIGPELMFGITMQRRLNEPILIIKTAWGGKSIHTDFRSPSAGPYVFNETQLQTFKKQKKDVADIKTERAKATGHYYRQMIEHVETVLADIKQVYPDYDVELGFELAGFVWFQGWNDMVDRGVYPNRDKAGGYDQYTEVLGHLIRDVRAELDSPKLPFVIGVMGAGGPTADYLEGQKRYKAVHQNFRDAMAAVARQPEFQGNIVNVLTEDCWDPQLTDLRTRQNKINQAIKALRKETELTRKAEAAKRTELMEKEFSANEREILNVGVSNAEYHYLGSAKIMALIGKQFAEALPVN